MEGPVFLGSLQLLSVLGEVKEIVDHVIGIMGGIDVLVTHDGTLAM